MSTRSAVLTLAGELAAAGEPYAIATVVDVVRPAPCRIGDQALIRADGELVGWVGGACARPVVVREALRALGDGTPRRVRVGPEAAAADATPGIVVAESHCASEGIVEVFIDARLPSPLLAVVGDSPAAETLVELASRVGWRVTRTTTPGVTAVVIAAMGQGDEDALAEALAATPGYVALIASSRRASAVRQELRQRGTDEEQLARIRSPAGLDLGPCTQEEIAVAVLAELIAWRHGRLGIGSIHEEAVDPVCGMTVPAHGATERLEHEGQIYYFCCSGCRSRFEREPARYLEELAR